MTIDEAISTLMENICMSCAYDENCMDECDIRGCDNRDAIKVIIGETEKHRWIPVTERLPNSNGCYLVWRPHFFGGEIGMPSICYFDGQNTWHDSYGVDFERVLKSEDVTAWMPLPKPYEGSETE